MLDYRLYFFDSAGKHIHHFEPVQALGDGEALELARLHTGRSPLELWLRGRQVGSFPTEIAAAAI
jgi:hypothetical protein